MCSATGMYSGMYTTEDQIYIFFRSLNGIQDYGFIMNDFIKTAQRGGDGRIFLHPFIDYMSNHQIVFSPIIQLNKKLAEKIVTPHVISVIEKRIIYYNELGDSKDLLSHIIYPKEPCLNEFIRKNITGLPHPYFTEYYMPNRKTIESIVISAVRTRYLPNLRSSKMSSIMQRPSTTNSNHNSFCGTCTPKRSQKPPRQLSIKNLSIKDENRTSVSRNFNSSYYDYKKEAKYYRTSSKKYNDNNANDIDKVMDYT